MELDGLLEGEYGMRREEFAQIRFHTHCLWNAPCKVQNQGQRLNTHSYQHNQHGVENLVQENVNLALNTFIRGGGGNGGGG